MDHYLSFVVDKGFSSSFIPNTERRIAPLRTNPDENSAIQYIKHGDVDMSKEEFAQIDNIISRQNYLLNVRYFRVLDPENPDSDVTYMFYPHEVAAVMLLTCQLPYRVMSHAFRTASPEVSAMGLDIFRQVQKCAENRWFFQGASPKEVQLCNAIGVRMIPLGHLSNAVEAEELYLPVMMDNTTITANEPVRDDQDPFWQLTHRMMSGRVGVRLAQTFVRQYHTDVYYDTEMYRFLVIGEAQDEEPDRFEITEDLTKFVNSVNTDQRYGFVFHDLRDVDLETMTCVVAFQNITPGVRRLDGYQMYYGYTLDYRLRITNDANVYVKPVRSPVWFEPPESFTKVYQNLTGHSVQQARRGTVIYRTFTVTDSRLLLLTWRKYRLNTVYLEAVIIGQVLNDQLVLTSGDSVFAESDYSIFCSGGTYRTEYLEELPVEGVYETSVCVNNDFDDMAYLISRDPTFFQKFLIFAATIGALADNDLPVRLGQADDRIRQLYTRSLLIRMSKGTRRDFILMNLWA